MQSGHTGRENVPGSIAVTLMYHAARAATPRAKIAVLECGAVPNVLQRRSEAIWLATSHTTFDLLAPTHE